MNRRRALSIIAAIALVLTTAGSGVAEAKHRPPPAASFQPPANVDPTGATDETADLNAFIASIPDGSTITFPPAARYRIEGTLVVSGKANLTIIGGTFKADTIGDPNAPGKYPIRNRAHWRVQDSTNIVFNGTAVEGPVEPYYSADTEAQHGFVASGGTNIRFTNVRVTNVLGDFVAVTNGAVGVTVSGGVFSGAGRQGFSVSEGSDIVFERNTLTRIRRSAVDVEPLLDWEVRNVTINYNTFTAPIGNSIFANIGSGPVVDGITVTNNAVIGVPFSVKAAAPCGLRRTNYVFSGNTSDTPMVLPLGFKRIDGLTITDNVFPTDPPRTGKNGTTGGVWLDLYGVNALALANNAVSGAVVRTSPSPC